MTHLHELENIDTKEVARKKSAAKQAILRETMEKKHLQEVVQRQQENLKKMKKEANPFPIHAFPAAVQDFIETYNKVYKFPTDYYGLGVLTVSAALIGNAYAAEFKPGWWSSPMIWGFIVGNSSTGKSHVQKHVEMGVKQIQKEMFEQLEIDLQFYEQELEEARNSKVKMEEPERPHAERILFQKATLEATTDLMLRNGRGLLLSRSELIGWVKSFNQYRSGDDGETYMEIWDNGTIMVDRKSVGVVKIERTNVSIWGGIQASIIRNLAAGDRAENGHLARCLFAFPDDLAKPKPNFDFPPIDCNERYLAIMRWLHNLPNDLVKPEKGIKYTSWQINTINIPLDGAAKRAYYEYLCNSTDRQNAAEKDIDRAILGKLDTYVLRFACILKLLDLAARGLPMGKEEMKQQTIGQEVIARSLMLMEYFKKTSEKVTQRIESPVNQLPPKYKAWYQALPFEELIKTSVAVESARKVDISERKCKELLSDKVLFRRKDRGYYERLHF